MLRSSKHGYKEVREVGETLDYYDTNAEVFIQGTAAVDFSDIQKCFLDKLPDNAYILDFGCGSGRDAKKFFDAGYRVDATDGSVEICKIASGITGINVKQMLFQELCETGKYDGIWACASILHVPSKQLTDILNRMVKALKPNGIIYASFKNGSFEGERGGRYYTDFTKESFKDFIEKIDNIAIEKCWITEDVRSEHGGEQWLNIILRII